MCFGTNFGENYHRTPEYRVVRQTHRRSALANAAVTG
jgi:hypothetical protein